MSGGSTRRQLLGQLGAAAVGLTLAGPALAAGSTRRRPRVAIARDDRLGRGVVDEKGELLKKMLDASLQSITGAASAGRAWSSLFGRDERVGIKVNALGLTTHPKVVEAIVLGLIAGGVEPDNILIWDRFDVELERAAFVLNRSGRGVQCRGTDARRGGRAGYQRQIEVSGEIGSCFSRIVAEEVDALISVPVLKDHNLAGVSLGMKNFFGAIHNPNKYHHHNCDPYIADVVAHRFIAPKWRLTVCDGTRAQLHNGPGRSTEHAWPFAGLITATDFVAADAVATSLLEKARRARGLPSLADEKRPPVHIATAGARGLGESDLDKIESVEV